MYKLIYTDGTCEIAGETYPGIPLLTQGNGTVVEPVSDWLRTLAVEGSHPATTLREYAQTLMLFWTYLGSVDWTRVDDALLVEWRNDQAATGVGPGTINGRLRLVFRFLYWAESTGRLNGVVGQSDVWVGGRRIPPQVRGVPSKGLGRQDSPLVPSMLYRRVQKVRRAYTPTSAETDRLHVELSQAASPYLSTRNTLMASWADEAGLRRKEFAALEIEQIPQYDELYAMLEEELLVPVRLVATKGEKIRTVPVAPELLLRTRDFIECERAALIAARRKRLRSYKPPSRVFLSSTTGRGMNLNAISNILTAGFKGSGIRGWGHRLRAKYLTALTEAYFQVEYQKYGTKFDPQIILLMVAEAAGHARISSLTPYLNLVVKRHVKRSAGQRSADAQARSLARLRLLESEVLRLSHSDELAEELTEKLGPAAAAAAMEIVTTKLRALTAPARPPRPDPA